MSLRAGCHCADHDSIVLPSASWSLHLIYVLTAMCVTAVFVMMYCTIPACQRLVALLFFFFLSRPLNSEKPFQTQPVIFKAFRQCASNVPWRVILISQKGNSVGRVCSLSSKKQNTLRAQGQNGTFETPYRTFATPSPSSAQFGLLSLD